jgi:hypothetical protein
MQFGQPDTVINPGPQGLNRYAYVNNNPINNTDPTGHRCIKWASDHCIQEDTSSSAASLNSGSAGSVVVGQSHPVETMSSLEEYAQENYDKTSSVPVEYQQPVHFGDMNSGDAAIYGINWVSVLSDQLSLWAPKHPANNVFIMVDWGYTEDKFYVPQIHLINFTMSTARIVDVLVEPTPNPWHQLPVEYGSSQSVGRNENNPGVLNFSLSNQGYSRDMGIFITVWVKVAAAPLPVVNKILIPGKGLQPGLSDPMMWITSPSNP